MGGTKPSKFQNADSRWQIFVMVQTMNSEAMKNRTKNFALLVIRLCRTVPRTEESRIIWRQLLRSATSVAANYRAVCRARSTPDFISKLGIVLEESDETLFWIELLVETGSVALEKATASLIEANELSQSSSPLCER